METDRAAHRRNAEGDAVDRQRRGSDQSADEAAARFVVAAQQTKTENRIIRLDR
jgi:hypothetical protein